MSELKTDVAFKEELPNADWWRDLAEKLQHAVRAWTPVDPSVVVPLDAIRTAKGYREGAVDALNMAAEIEHPEPPRGRRTIHVWRQ